MQRHLLTLVGGLDPRVFELHVACPCSPSLAGKLEKLGAKVWPLEFGRGLLSPRDPLAILGLARIILRLKPDIVHLHGFKAGFAGRLAGVFLRGPQMVYTVHNAILSRLPRLVERSLAYCASEVITVSEFVRREYLRATGLPEEKVTCIYNGIDLSSLGKAERKAPEGILIGSCARLIPSKGMRFLIEAAPRILTRFPGARFSIIGDGPERGSLEALARELGAGSAIRFLGYRSEAAKLFSGFSIFVLPTLSEGGVPLVILEAMALGVPVVATDVNGVGEVVRDGVTGRLAPPRDPEALSQVICDLLENPQRADEMAQRARDIVLDKFNVAGMVSATESIYKRVMQLERA